MLDKQRRRQLSKLVDFLRSDVGFESCTVHNKNPIGEQGNEKLSPKKSFLSK